MKCPFCSKEDTQVIDSRVNEQGNSIRRRRRCSSCEKRFTTYEHIELSLPQVVKQDESEKSSVRRNYYTHLQGHYIKGLCQLNL